MRRILSALVLLLPAALMAGGKGTVYVGSHTFKAEAATTEAEREQGLMYRKHLASDACMIFLYPQSGPHAIWMRNCYISLDIVWTDASGKIVELAENVPPCDRKLWGLDPCPCPTTGGNVDSATFTEFSAGTIKRMGIRKGDDLRWDITLDDGTLVKGGNWGMMFQGR